VTDTLLLEQSLHTDDTSTGLCFVISHVITTAVSNSNLMLEK